MKPSLAGCIEKLDRAEFHIKQIDVELRAKAKSYRPTDSIRQYTETQDTDVEGAFTRRTIIVFRLHGTAPQLPLLFSILAGEAIHQLRTILDHLVYQMVIARTQRPPTFKSAFPVIGKGRMKNRVWQTADELFADHMSCLKTAITHEAATLIHGLQPYKRLGADYQNDPLWQLTELDNAYKHRLLQVVGNKVKTCRFTFRLGDTLIAEGEFEPNVMFENRAEIGRFPLTHHSMSDPNVSVDGKVLFAIAFPKVAARTNVGVLECLQGLHAYVSRIIKDVSALPAFPTLLHTQDNNTPSD